MDTFPFGIILTMAVLLIQTIIVFRLEITVKKQKKEIEDLEEQLLRAARGEQRWRERYFRACRDIAKHEEEIQKWIQGPK